MKMQKPLQVVVVAVACLVGVVVGYAGISFAQVPQQTSATTSQQQVVPKSTAKAPASAPVYAKNAAGQTFGTALAYDGTPESLPDLVSVITGAGQVGYARSSDVFPEAFASHQITPEQVLANQARQAVAVVVPVYQVDGKTQIGTYSNVPGEASGVTK